MVRGRLTYANVVASLALLVALSSGAYAAGVLPEGSVGTKQLKGGAVTSGKIHDGTVQPRDVRTGTSLATGGAVALDSVTISCGANVLLKRNIRVSAPSRILGASTGTWNANQNTGNGFDYTVQTQLTLTHAKELLGVTKRSSSRSESGTNQKAGLGVTGVLLDTNTDKPTVLVPGRTYTLSLVATVSSTDAGTCSNSPLVNAAQLSDILLANRG